MELIIYSITINKQFKMGASLVYLESPNKNVEFEIGENDKVEFVAASMQGWRINMVSISQELTW